ncbi:unnamed protein product [Closterium sp. Naga37s-1]|nr:unnamed protein product [Closterium sp. Naga37s-1]
MALVFKATGRNSGRPQASSSPSASAKKGRSPHGTPEQSPGGEAPESAQATSHLRSAGATATPAFSPHMKRTPSSLSGSPLAPKYGGGASPTLPAAAGRAGNPSSAAARRGGAAAGGGDGGVRGSPSPFSLRRPALSASGSAGGSAGRDAGVSSGAAAAAAAAGGGSERDGSGTTDSSVGSGILTAADLLAYRAASVSTRKGSLHGGQSRSAHRQRHDDQSAHEHGPRHRQKKSLDDRESLSFRHGFRHAAGLDGSPSSNRVAQPSKGAAAAKSAHRPAAVAAATDAASSAGSVASDSSDVSTPASESASASRRGGHASPRAKPMVARQKSSQSPWRSPSASFPSPPAAPAAASSAGAKSRGEVGASPLSARAPQQEAARAMMLRRSRSFSTFSRAPSAAPAATGAIAGASSAAGSNSDAHSACNSAASACASGDKRSERDGGGGSTSTRNKLLRSQSAEGSCDVRGGSAALYGRAGAASSKSSRVKGARSRYGHPQHAQQHHLDAPSSAGSAASARRDGAVWSVVDPQSGLDADWGSLGGFAATGDAPRTDSRAAASARTARTARVGSGASERSGSTPTGSRPALSRSRSGLSTGVFRRLSFSCEGDEATGEKCGLVAERHSEEEQEGEGGEGQGTGRVIARTTALAASDYDGLYGTGRVARGGMASRGLDCQWWDKIRDELDALRALVEESASTAARSHPAATTAAAPPQASPRQGRQSLRLRRGMLVVPSTKEGGGQAPALLAADAGGGAALEWLGRARRELESMVGGRGGRRGVDCGDGEHAQRDGTLQGLKSQERCVASSSDTSDDSSSTSANSSFGGTTDTAVTDNDANTLGEAGELGECSEADIFSLLATQSNQFIRLPAFSWDALAEGPSAETATGAAAGETKEGAVEASEGAARGSESVDVASLQQATLSVRSISAHTAPHAHAHLPAPAPPALPTPGVLPSAGGWLGRPRGKPSGAGLIGARAAGGGGKRAGEVVLLGRGKEEHLQNHMVVSDLLIRRFALGLSTFLVLAACRDYPIMVGVSFMLRALSSPPTLLPHSLSFSVSPMSRRFAATNNEQRFWARERGYLHMLGLPSSHQGAAMGHAQGVSFTNEPDEGVDERQADGSFETQCLGLSTHGRSAPLTCAVAGAGAASDVASHASRPCQGASIPTPMSASQRSGLSSTTVLPPAPPPPRPPNYLQLQQQHRMPSRATSRPPGLCPSAGTSLLHPALRHSRLAGASRVQGETAAADAAVGKNAADGFPSTARAAAGEIPALHTTVATQGDCEHVGKRRDDGRENGRGMERLWGQEREWDRVSDMRDLKLYAPRFNPLFEPNGNSWEGGESRSERSTRDGVRDVGVWPEQQQGREQAQLMRRHKKTRGVLVKRGGDAVEGTKAEAGRAQVHDCGVAVSSSCADGDAAHTCIVVDTQEGGLVEDTGSEEESVDAERSAGEGTRQEGGEGEVQLAAGDGSGGSAGVGDGAVEDVPWQQQQVQGQLGGEVEAALAARGSAVEGMHGGDGSSEGRGEEEALGLTSRGSEVVLLGSGEGGDGWGGGGSRGDGDMWGDTMLGSRVQRGMGHGSGGGSGGSFMGGYEASGIVFFFLPIPYSSLPILTSSFPTNLPSPPFLLQLLHLKLLAHVRVPLSALHVVLLVARPSLLARCLTALAGIIWGPRPWRLGAREDGGRGESGRGVGRGRADGHGGSMEGEEGGRRGQLLLSNGPSTAPGAQATEQAKGRIEGDDEGEREGEAGGHRNVQEQVPLAATPPPITPVASSPMPCLPAPAATTLTHQPCITLGPLAENPALAVGDPLMAVARNPPSPPLVIPTPPSSFAPLAAEAAAAPATSAPRPLQHHPEIEPVNEEEQQQHEQQPHRIHLQRFPPGAPSLPSHACHPLPHLPIVLPASACAPHVGLAQHLSVVAWERVLAAVAEGRRVDAALWMTCQALLAATLAAGSVLPIPVVALQAVDGEAHGEHVGNTWGAPGDHVGTMRGSNGEI